MAELHVASLLLIWLSDVSSKCEHSQHRRTAPGNASRRFQQLLLGAAGIHHIPYACTPAASLKQHGTTCASLDTA